MLSRSKNNQIKAGLGWASGWGAGEGGDLPSGPPLPHPHPTPPLIPDLDPWPGKRACARVGRPGRRRQGGPQLPTPAPSPPPADSVWPLACGCVFVCRLFHLACSLQLNPFQTRGALTRHHDEAESEADTASRWPFSLSHTHPLPSNTHAHTHSPSSLLNSQCLCGGQGRGLY